jgi:group I intron endonuclease
LEQGIIYLIINIVNNKKYVGQTRQQLNKRWKYHITESRTFSDRPLYRAINKYGIDNFKIRIIEECNTDLLDERETYWIDSLETYRYGYNTTTGGEHPEHSEETRNKISESMTNLSRSDEWKDNISIGLKNKLERGERWGMFLTKNPGGTHAKRKVQATSIITGEVIEFDSINDAGRKLNLKGGCGNLSRAIRDGIIAYGYKWKRLDDRPIIKPVVGYDKKTGELVYEFESANKASLSIRGKRGTGLHKSLKNPGKNSWMGCYWYYKT